MPRIIEVIVSPRGETTVQTKGFEGAECRKASKALEETLGITTNETKTAEFYHEAEARQSLTQSP